MTRVEWKGKTAFAEVAEALGVETRDIMAAMVRGTGYFATWTTGTSDDLDDPSMRIWSAFVERGEDGVLFVSSVPRESPEALTKLRAALGELREGGETHE